MQRHQLLARLHELVQPRTYFEIGVRKGRSLTLSRVPSVGVDPFFVLTHELHCDVHLVRTTSDEFFARRHPFAHFPVPVVDLAFIDGMHLAEFALRDLINTERHCHPASVIVIDDMLPRSVVEAGRGRVGSAENGAWAGDVYKIVDVLRERRPDLVVVELDTQPTGTVVVLAPDPEDTSLAAAYDDVVGDLVTPDPQEVPERVLTRADAIDPASFLAGPLWKELRAARRHRAPDARRRVREACERAGLVDPAAGRARTSAPRLTVAPAAEDTVAVAR